jgi:hypothetical protein
MTNIEISPQFNKVLNFVDQTNHLIFLTGKAGTGKTTLLRYLKQNTFKQLSVVAPTGVAAINAGGSTIHSFFQFPFAPFLPVLNENGDYSSSQNLPTLKYNSQRLAIFRNLELLVIDEISMVRADLLDQIDLTLRQTRKKWHLPFGGVQVLLIGDMHQLSPVVQPEEWKLLAQVYKSQYFFDSLVMQNHPPVYIELDKIYRQSEAKFIHLLNQVRTNQLDAEGLQVLNSHYKENITKEDYKNNITLTTHNRKADEINLRNLNELEGKTYKFKAKAEGIFSEKNYPAEEELQLKKGTRVMFLKNNTEKNYYNGKIGIISFIDDEKIKVKCEEDQNEIEVIKETWTNVAYKVDKSTKHIDEEILGTFSQFPLRLAWAITIHKSQGLTFDKLIIDAADSFSAGQVYVALSRCRSLSGLTLSTKIHPKTLVNDSAILGFANTKHDAEQVNTIFNSAHRSFIKTLLIELFDFSEIYQRRKDMAGIIHMYATKIKGDSQNWTSDFYLKLDVLNDVSQKFKTQLALLTDNAANLESDTAIQERIKQAANYFETEISNTLQALKNCDILTESKEAATDLNDLLQQIMDGLYKKQTLINACKFGFQFSEFVKQKLNLRYPDFKINVYASSKNTKVAADVKYPDLFKKLVLQRDEICNESGTPVYMVANLKALIELTNYLPVTEAQLLKISGFGSARAEAYGMPFLRIIREYVAEHHLHTDEEALKTKREKKAKKEKKSQQENYDPFAPSEKKVNTKEQTFMLFNQGMSVAEIASKRGFTVGTIEGHLIPYIANGEIEINQLVSATKKKLIQTALQNFNYEEGINPIKAQLPADISFSEIRFVMASRLKDA